VVTYKKPTRKELWGMSREDLLKQLNLAHEYIKEQRLTVRSKNITIREIRVKSDRHWRLVKRYREAVGPLNRIERLYKDETE